MWHVQVVDKIPNVQKPTYKKKCMLYMWYSEYLLTTSLRSMTSFLFFEGLNLLVMRARLNYITTVTEY